MEDSAGRSAPPKVAVVAVHGVADQGSGDTLRSLADLLVGHDDAAVRYGPAVEQAVSLTVEPLQPLRPVVPLEPLTFFQRWAKALRQSWRSDHGSDARHAAADLRGGAQLTDYLLHKAVRNGAAPEAWRTVTASMRRNAADAHGGPAQVDLYELYWADLSRLSSALPRLVTELFTLLFRLSLLGRDTIDHSLVTRKDPPGRRWRLLRLLQSGFDWGFSRVLALLDLQMVMLGLLGVPLGLLIGHEQLAFEVALVVGGVALAWWACYRLGGAWRWAWPFVVAGVGAAVLWAWRLPPDAGQHWALGVAWLVVLSIGLGAVLRVTERRFPFTAPMGWAMWACVVTATVWVAATRGDALLRGRVDLGVWVVGGMAAFEGVLGAISLWWFVAGLLLVGWAISGALASRAAGVPRARATVATGRLGLFASASFFLVLSMGAWAVASRLVGLSMLCVPYEPWLYTHLTDVPNHFGVEIGAACRVGEQLSAANFVQTLYERSTEAFSLVAVAAFALLAWLLTFLLPSVVAELQLRLPDGARMGRWLATAFRYLDDVAVRVIVWAAALGALTIGTYLLLTLVPGHGGHALAGAYEALDEAMEVWRDISRAALGTLVVGAASASVALSALGGLLSRQLPGLRAPLDIALDVDNHFREFPRRAIPRARIFSRYHALLRRLDAEGYDRIVIVAHSQGTVLTADLLHYLVQRHAARPGDEAAAVGARVAQRAQLLTLGCPLRQLYASRFPALYDWVLANDGQCFGPKAEALGLPRWVNAYATGDYVGRWLWSQPTPGREPMPADARRVDGGSVHEAIPADEVAPRLARAPEVDLCLGTGAHTHYFEPVRRDPAAKEPRRASVAQIVDALIASDPRRVQFG